MPRVAVESVAEGYLVLLKARGIDWLFANAGTDFAPLIEAFARGTKAGLAMPEPVTVPHETVAVGMAHGYYLATGRPQAVMVHVNVGMANALMGLLNAVRDDIPIFFTAGRTPITEAGRLGSRDLPIHWGQEMFDQAAMLREYVKWDYELRGGDQLSTVIDRALAIAMAPPRGPVCLSLPREVLAAQLDGFTYSETPRQQPPAPPQPAADAIADAAERIAGARRPLIIAGRGSVGGEASDVLARFAERFAIPVVHFWPSRLALPTTHPMHAGFDAGPWLEDADLILVLDAMVPWIPSRQVLVEGCTVIQIGPDPLFSKLPVRGFPADLAIAAEPAAVISALDRVLDRSDDDLIEARRVWAQARIAKARDAVRERIAAARTTPMGAAWISHCLDQVKGDAMLFNELGCDPATMTFARPDGWFSHSLAGGLGWGLPAALGAQLADRERLVIAAIGDGSYIFANPVACHQVAAALELPVLTIVFDNARWDAVRKSTAAVYPDGHAVQSNRMALVSLDPSPAYEQIVRACGGHGERVENPEELPTALERALHVVRVERRQALLDVVCA